MDIKEAVKSVGEKFVYKQDQKVLFDHWSVMRENDDGSLRGDCDDFALTSLWRICDEDILSFVVNVLILHRFRIYYAKTKNGEGHAIGYAKGLWFDNWTKEAVSKEDFLKKTGHKIYVFYPSPFMLIPLVLGFLMRFKKR